jgi:hypothetical protein
MPATICSRDDRNDCYYRHYHDHKAHDHDDEELGWTHSKDGEKRHGVYPFD